MSPSKYFHRAEDLAAKWDGAEADEILSWLTKFILHGLAAPLVGIADSIPRSVVVDQIYQSSTTQTREIIRRGVIHAYNHMHGTELNSVAFVELLDTVARLSLSEFFPELWRQAFDGTFKGRKTKHFGITLELHSELLRTIFGLTLNTESEAALLSLVRRDILDPEYEMVCFNALSRIPGHLDETISFLPRLLRRNPSEIEGQYDIVANLLKALSPEDAVRAIRQTARDIEVDSSSSQLTNNFLLILERASITVTQLPAEGGGSIPVINVDKVSAVVSESEFLDLASIVRRQTTRQIGQFTRLAAMGSASNHIVAILERLGSSQDRR